MSQATLTADAARRDADASHYLIQEVRGVAITGCQPDLSERDAMLSLCDRFERAAEALEAMVAAYDASLRDSGALARVIGAARAALSRVEA